MFAKVQYPSLLRNNDVMMTSLYRYYVISTYFALASRDNTSGVKCITVSTLFAAISENLAELSSVL